MKIIRVDFVSKKVVSVEEKDVVREAEQEFFYLMELGCDEEDEHRNIQYIGGA